jgi:predicted DCC family thiol-disulfide oxidoreductase YuxK
MSTNQVLIYDGDCKFCQLSLEFGIKHMATFPSYVAFQKINPANFGLTDAQVRAEIWLVETDSTTNENLGGHLAAAAILRMQTNILYRILGWLMKTPPTSWLAKIGYRWIANNRHRLPGGSRTCNLVDNYDAGK